jgi:hypothetical protein
MSNSTGQAHSKGNSILVPSAGLARAALLALTRYDNDGLLLPGDTRHDVYVRRLQSRLEAS